MAIRIVDVTDDATFALLPPCADPGFDHRSCDYWEDADRGSKAARLSWLDPSAAPPPLEAGPARNPFGEDDDDEPAFNPFAPARREAFNPFLSADDDAPENPFAPKPKAGARRSPHDAPSQAAAARPRAGGLRELREGAARRRRARRVRPVRAAVRLPAGAPHPRALPEAARSRRCRRSSPASRRPPRRATRATPRCSSRRSATTSPARGFAAVETYPERGDPRERDERRHAGVLGAASGSSSRRPTTRFPVMRRELA